MFSILALTLSLYAAGEPAESGAVRGVSDGLLHWYAAEGDATDSAGSIDGTIVGAVGFTPSPVGAGFDFSGAGEVSIPSPVGHFGTDDFALAFWVRGAPGQSLQIMSKRSVCSCHQFWDIRGGISLSMEMYEVCQGITGGVGLGGQTVLDETWHHVVLQREGSSRRGYVDGVLRSILDTGAIAVVDVDAPMRLNAGPCIGADGTVKFNGALDEIRIYNRALTIAEVRELAGRCAGDVDGDGFVGFADLNAALGSFNLSLGDEDYNAAADFDGDGDVDFGDLNVALSAFNSSC